MKKLIFDIETIANPAMVDLLPTVEPDSRLKDPMKIKANIEQKKEKQVSEMGLDPTTNLICVIVMMDIGNGVPVTISLDPETLDEKSLLKSFWIIASGYDQFISFNGISFDVPTLKFHSMLHNVKPTVNLSQAKYRITNHVDVRMILGNWETYARGTQDYYCNILLGEGKKDGFDGSHVQHMWDTGQYDEIREYCIDDVRKLGDLYKRLVGYYL